MGKTGFHFCGSCSKYTRDPQGPASILRRGGRVVECTALEMRHTGNRIGGSNPSLSASYEFQRISANTHEAKKPNVYGVSFSHYRYAHHAHAFHRQHRARRAELSIPLITRLKNPKANVCFWHKADISRLSPNVRFLGVKQTYP